MSGFDFDVFFGQEITGAHETKFTPVPEGEYTGFIDEIAGAEFGDSKVLQVTYMLTDERLKEELKMDKVTVRDTVFLEFESDGRLAFGKNKNIKLGKLREAAGQNTPGAWNFRMLTGAGPFKLKISHRFDKKTGDGPFANVDRIVRA